MFANPPEPRRQVGRGGMWFGPDWLQYEGWQEGSSVHVTYLAPPRSADGKPDLSDCEARVRRYDGPL